MSDAFFIADDATATGRWFVYLFALADCSAFKVGFSRSPLQRIYTFSHRYFERFDLHDSLLLQLDANAAVRAAETALKLELAPFRASCPEWIPREAGGHTEWFSAVQRRQAEERLDSLARVHPGAQAIEPFDLMRDELAGLMPSFEPWAWHQAQTISEALSYAGGVHALPGMGRLLRDWLDAYRYFGLTVFRDDTLTQQFVEESARRSC
ncbi:MAG TPA: GIY-YIG nuclease family protein [Povalibacter sp.]|nr:GIY-YIG nuclease family protein [Povalibacter sp.]